MAAAAAAAEVVNRPRRPVCEWTVAHRACGRRRVTSVVATRSYYIVRVTHRINKSEGMVKWAEVTRHPRRRVITTA